MNLQSDRASFPAVSPPPFDQPILLDARHVTGIIVTENEDANEDDEDDKDDKNSGIDANNQMSDYGHTSIVLDAPELKRSQTLTGDILSIGDTKYMIQRKLRNTTNGSARIGYVLQHAGPSGEKKYKFKPNENQDVTFPYEMVTVRIQDKTSYESGQFSEQASLQLIAAHNNLMHIEGSSVIAASMNHIYTLTPLYRDGTLFDYCAQSPSETESQCVFKQLLLALEALQTVELCHRNISLDNVYFRGKECFLTSMEYALKIPKVDGTIHMIEPQPIGGDISPQFCAPELFREEAFDGYAIDLWSVGVLLFAMLLGSDALWAAPVVEDKTFHQVCMKKDLKGFVECLQVRLSPDSGKEFPGKLSDSSLDLLQNILIAEAKERYTLTQVLQHPWVTTHKELEV